MCSLVRIRARVTSGVSTGMDPCRTLASEVAARPPDESHQGAECQVPASASITGHTEGHWEVALALAPRARGVGYHWSCAG
jgi:hypothetical protein